jgi:RND family efflux transporter MFP subunit
MTGNQDQMPSATATQYVLWAVTAIAVLVVGIIVFIYFSATRPEPKKVKRVVLGELVEVIAARPDRQKVWVPASGQVLPAQQVAMSSELGGRVIWMSEKLIPGGRLAAGDELVRIDPREYSLALEQQAAQVDRAQTELQLEQSRKEIAEREWQLMGGGQPAEGSLAVRDPQMRTAEAALKAARSGLSQAKLSVSKSTVRAPFNAMVHSKAVDLGQLVGPQLALATLVGTDAFWVQVSIPLERLAWIQVPGVDSATEGATAVISQRLGDKTITRKGKVLRLLPDLDPMGRMARLLVEIPDPLGLAAGKAAAAGQGADADAIEEKQDLPLLIGSYVTVEIEGREVDDAIELPREAVRGGDTVYVMAEGGTLDVRQVSVVWRRPESVLIGAGLAAGDRVVVSPLQAPVKGMKLRTAQTSAKGPQTASDAPAGEADPVAPAAQPGAIPQEPDHKPGAGSGPRSVSPAKDSGGASSSADSQSASKVANPNR